ncbi:MAG: hypothetical protein N3F66_13700 [Spirochaetes bacterium]|nr:hypothetical protein [Spirochaetota bacterium]
MKCEKAIEKYLMLDNNKPIPLSVQIHCILCSKCRNEINNLSKAFSLLKNFAPYTINLDNVIMSKIYSQKQYYNKVSNLNWIAVGSVIFLSTGLISYSDALKWLTLHFGTSIVIPLYLVLGCVVSGYIGSYVATHMKKLRAIAQNIKSLL